MYKLVALFVDSTGTQRVETVTDLTTHFAASTEAYRLLDSGASAVVAIRTAGGGWEWVFTRV